MMAHVISNAPSNPIANSVGYCLVDDNISSLTTADNNLFILSSDQCGDC